MKFKFKIRITFLNCQHGGSMVRNWDLSKVPGPEDLKKAFGTFRPPLWKIHNVSVVEFVNEEEVKNPVTFQLETELLLQWELVQQLSVPDRIDS